MNKKAHGFTIIELLIVIVVIAILAAVSIVAYNGIQERVKLTAKVSELNQWVRLFEVYRALNGEFPSMTAGTGYCLGTGFPNGSSGVPSCRELGSTDGVTMYLESDSQTLMDALKTVGSLPSGDRQAVRANDGRYPLVGPYVDVSPTQLSFMISIKGSSLSECPSPTQGAWTDGFGRLLCRIRINR